MTPRLCVARMAVHRSLMSRNEEAWWPCKIYKKPCRRAAFLGRDHVLDIRLLPEPGPFILVIRSNEMNNNWVDPERPPARQPNIPCPGEQPFLLRLVPAGARSLSPSSSSIRSRTTRVFEIGKPIRKESRQCGVSTALPRQRVVRSTALPLGKHGAKSSANPPRPPTMGFFSWVGFPPSPCCA